MPLKGYANITVKEALKNKIKRKAEKHNRTVPDQIEFDTDHCQEG